MLGITIHNVWVKRHRGQLPAAMKIGRSVRWPKARIDAWLETDESAGGGQ